MPGLARLARTILPLGPRRVLLRGLRPMRRRIAALSLPRESAFRPISFRAIAMSPVPCDDGGWDGRDGFRFQGVDARLGDPLDWSRSPTSLWAYHLHYLEALRDPRHPRENRRSLFREWMAGNRRPAGVGWEAYPTSLRLVNALEWIAGGPGGADPEMLVSLARQAEWLTGILEIDIGANHLWKNGVALAFAGRLLESSRSRRWRRIGDRVALQALGEQVLPDGFHYERTPSYHALFVEDLIRLHDLLAACGETTGALYEATHAALGASASALASILHRDGRIPLFNDSAFRQAPRAGSLLEHAHTRLGRLPEPRAEGAPAAGLHRLDGRRSRMIVDAGETGCAVQPGHAHADTLSFELSVDGQRIVVDAGVYDYQDSETRRYARSTSSHNTLEIDGLDQSEMWSAFRVGRRARPLDVRRESRAGRPVLEAGHDGYRHLPGAPIHRRRIEYVGEESWRIVDRVTGGGRHRAVGRLRLHPDFELRRIGAGVWEARRDRLRVRIVAEGELEIGREDGWYFPEMGTMLRAGVLVFDREGTLPIETVWRIEIEGASVSGR